MEHHRVDAGFLQSLSKHSIFSVPPKEILAFDESVTLEDLRHASSATRKNVMCFRGSDLIVAVGSELRITTLVDPRNEGGSTGTYKTLHTPNIQFNIHQLVLCPGGKMLAVAGKHQVAVIMLPRQAYYKLVTAKVDCKSIQVGQYYHAMAGSSQIAKVEWHPWNDGGSSLLVMTADGYLREYDVSMDTDEPQQVLSFIPNRKTRGAYTVDDESSQEVVSFTIGKGKADWGPLTIYALMRSGDVWAMSPFMPSNALIPSSFVPSLHRYVSAKRDTLAAQVSTMKYPPAESDAALQTYDYQLKYVNALLKQLPSDLSDPSISKPVHLQAPSTIRNSIARQGPFLFQPAPRELAGSEDREIEACDIVYLGFEDDDESSGEAERLGLVLISFKDGKIDVCFDVERIEAKWDVQQKNVVPRSHSDLPLLTVYESIDLGIISLVSGTPMSTQNRLLSDNSTSFHLDPLYADRVYVSHAFGIHILDMRRWLKSILGALKGNQKRGELERVLKEETGTEVTHVLNTFSVPHQTSVSIIATSIVNSGFINYTLFALTSNFHLVPIELSLRLHDNEEPPAPAPLLSTTTSPSTQSKQEEAWLSVLKPPFEIPAALSRPASSRLSLPPPPPSNGQNQVITPDTLRFLGKTVERLRSEIRDVTRSANTIQSRITLQDRELSRQLSLLSDMERAIDRLNKSGGEGGRLRLKLDTVMGQHQKLDERLNRCLQVLMDNYEPKLSEPEKQWFGELKRMKVDIDGDDGRSLHDRTQKLKHQLEVLRPGLQELAEKEADRRKRTQGRGSALGTAQLHTVQSRLTQEKKMLEDMKSKMEILTERVSRVNLG